MAKEPAVDPMYGKPMSQPMRYTLWALFAVLSLGGMGFVTWEWRQQKKTMQARSPKIDRSSKERNKISPATPLKEPRFAKPKAAGAAGASGAKP